MPHGSHWLTLLTSWILLWFAHSAQSAPSIVNRPETVCTYLARTANKGSLARIALGEHGANDPAFPVPEKLADWELAFKNLLDINNDGKREYVYVVQYPIRHEDPSSTSIQDLVIRGSFSIPRSGSPRQELFIYDQAMQEISIQSAEEPTRALADDADQYRFLLHRNSYYVVAQRGADLRYVLKIDSSNTAQPVCAFEQYASGKRMRARALTTYQWLKKSLEGVDGHQGILWEYAFHRDDLAVAELLIKNGHSIDEKIDEDSLLTWALREERVDIAEWLLDRGADPNGGRPFEAPLKMVIGADTVMTLKLIRHGADPAPFLYEIAGLPSAPPEQKRSVMVAAIDSLGYVPEEFVLDALDKDLSLLDSLVASRVPVRPLGVSWHAGERTWLSFHVDRYIRGKAASSAKVIARLFRRGTIPPESNFAIASYGSYAHGVQVIRYGGSRVSDADFLSFATALCYYFMPFDCGAEELIVRARAWAGALRDECPESLRSVLDEPACRLAAHYRDIGREKVHAFTVSEDGSVNKGDRVVEWKQLLETYRAKHSR